MEPPREYLAAVVFISEILSPLRRLIYCYTFLMTHSYQQKYLYGTLLVIILICVGAYVLQKSNGEVYPTEPTPTVEITKFTDSQKRFSINVPDGARVITDKATMAMVGYMPSCNTDTAVACIVFASSTYPNSNFQNASISLNVSPLMTETLCLAQNHMEQKSDGLITISGVSFASFSAGDAAMSHQSSGIDYRTFKDNTCYEITTRVNTTTYEVYEEGSIQRFTDSQKIAIEQAIEKAVQSFTFLK